MLSKIIQEENVYQAKKLINKYENFVITAHIAPDGDALGSSLGLYHYLKELDKNVTIVLNDKAPEFLQWLEGVDMIVDYETQCERAELMVSEAEVIFCVDFNEPKRMGDMQSIVLNSNAKKIMVDHHLDPDMFCDVTISHPGISSTCELVFRLICRMEDSLLINKACATALYTGMMTDTGAFTYNSNSPELFMIIAELLRKGVNKDEVYNRVFNSNSENRERLIGYAIYKKMTLIKEYGASLISLTKAEQLEFNYQKGDSEGLVNKPLSIKGIKCSVYFREEPNYVKVSLRSKGDIAVNVMAEKYFNGGGHKNAAGGEFEGTLEQAEQIFRDVLPLFINNLQD